MTIRQNRNNIYVASSKAHWKGEKMKNIMRMTLKTARELSGLLQKEAANKLGISVETLGNYERGKSYPDIPTLRKIEKLYGVPYSRLIFLPLDYDKTVNLI